MLFCEEPTEGLLTMVQCQAQLEELVLKRGAVPRFVLTAGLQNTTDENIAHAIMDVSMQDLAKAAPGTSRASHRIAKIHPPKWREGRKDPVRSSTVCLLSIHFLRLLVL